LGVTSFSTRFSFAALACAFCAVPVALAQKSTEDGLRDCEKLAVIKFKQENSEFKKFAIARADVEEDKFADKVGTQFVSTVYHGKAIYQAAGAPDNVGFICLHGGLGKGAVFVYTLPR
jgi:hypothetical protein